ncbi:DUF3604 domain-containing protein [Ruegeria arenilitoris]|uniref:DUF3604 domain-containing protein n=2 Tax=Ruegeria arenilitoris TaxID=1173585 RepID=UPI00147EBE03|nr:DUF3604 domain-containing protein [Ruegeria arenilitoris]
MLRFGLVCAMGLAAFQAFAQDINPTRDEVEGLGSSYSPYVDKNMRKGGFAENLYWGDTHLHTSVSGDAGLLGTYLDPEDAYRFARGEEVTTNTGQRAKLVRPLDFLVVADHAENLGMAPMLAEANADLLKTEWGRQFYDLIEGGDPYRAYQLWTFEGLAKQVDLIDDPGIAQSAWQRQLDHAAQFNDPGTFTALIGFEWTMSGTFEEPGNLHRVVIFRDDEDKAGQVIPFSLFDSDDVEDLWAYMQAYEDDTGGDVLAIPHNGNLSNGRMFSLMRQNGEPIDADYAATRQRWEPVVETTQTKGDSETHPFLSPDDEFADYGIWDKADLGGVAIKTPEMLPYEYTRSALQIGLQVEQDIGMNPFKYGMIGASDSHTGLSTTREENFFGKTNYTEPAPDRWDHAIIEALLGDDELTTYQYEILASGLAGVWAHENTRAALFDAIERREVYATTGNRMTVRFFGGWEYEPNDANRPDVVEIGYHKGVPMGGDLPEAPESAEAPVFMVGALKDAWSGNLDRIQIVKGWVDATGERQERIYDVAVSDGRTIDDDGRATEPVGTTVDETAATWINSIGAPELRAVWTDPDFDPMQPAVYYARVLEIPTPTWMAYDEARYGITMGAEGILRSHQERAYTSPIWYTPR